MCVKFQYLNTNHCIITGLIQWVCAGSSTHYYRISDYVSSLARKHWFKPVKSAHCIIWFTFSVDTIYIYIAMFVVYYSYNNIIRRQYEIVSSYLMKIFCYFNSSVIVASRLIHLIITCFPWATLTSWIYLNVMYLFTRHIFSYTFSP